MGSVTLKKRDLARYSKVYPYTRPLPRYVYVSDESFDIESAVVDFNGTDTATYTFLNTYDAVPVVIATSLNDAFNVFISSISTTQVIIKASVANNDSASIVVVQS
jgi:hypothetical protein